MDIHKNVGSNSYKSREGKNDDDIKQIKRAERIANGVKLEKGTPSKIAEIFFPDGINSEDIWDYLLRQRIAPGIMSGLRSLCDDVLDAIFGSPKRKGGYTYYSSDRGTPYSSLYKMSHDKKRKDIDSGEWHKAYSYADIVFRTRAEAEEVKDALEDILYQYEVVRVADLYDLAGLDPEPTDSYYGWTSLKHAEVKRIAGGNFTIKLPKATPID